MDPQRHTHLGGRCPEVVRCAGSAGYTDINRLVVKNKIQAVVKISEHGDFLDDLINMGGYENGERNQRVE